MSGLTSPEPAEGVYPNRWDKLLIEWTELDRNQLAALDPLPREDETPDTAEERRQDGLATISLELGRLVDIGEMVRTMGDVLNEDQEPDYVPSPRVVSGYAAAVRDRGAEIIPPGSNKERIFSGLLAFCRGMRTTIHSRAAAGAGDALTASAILLTANIVNSQGAANHEQAISHVCGPLGNQIDQERYDAFVQDMEYSSLLPDMNLWPDSSSGSKTS